MNALEAFPGGADEARKFMHNWAESVLSVVVPSMDTNANRDKVLATIRLAEKHLDSLAADPEREAKVGALEAELVHANGRIDALCREADEANKRWRSVSDKLVDSWAERDKLAADLAAAQKERDVAVTGARDFRAAWEREKRWREDDRAAAKAEGARAVKILRDMVRCLDSRSAVYPTSMFHQEARSVVESLFEPQPTTAAPATTSDRTPKEGKQPIFWAPWRESGATVRQGDDRLSDRPACEEVVRTFNPVTATPSETWVYLQCRRALEGKLYQHLLSMPLPEVQP